jgi:hypothetical protein
VKPHGDGHPATGNTSTLELGHLVDRWNSVASSAECLPRKAWKTLPVETISTDHTISVVLEKHGGSHLYKISTTCQDSKESNMSNGANLAVVNKNS